MKKRLKYLDMIPYSLFILTCFLLFTHNDIITTGNNSMLLLNGNIMDFYSASKEFTGAYGANYMPSTFFLFALWNIPVRLFAGPLTSIDSISLIQIYWYKLLPCIFFFLTTLQLRKLCDKIGFSKEKALFVCSAFLTAPLALYSQFMFCQYDIFTVFFMVVGLCYYFEDSQDIKTHRLFCVFFGIAITFKYQALLFFLVLLLFKEKKIGKIFTSVLTVFIPIALETSAYLILDKDAFTKAVLHFSALDKVTAGVSGNAFTTINPFMVLICLLLAISFFLEYSSKKDFICNAFFLCCGVCFGLFGLMEWHPQWLLLGVIFWTISACMNKYCDIFLLLDSAGILVFYMFICKMFPDNVDQRLLVNGILNGILKYKDRNDITMMQDVYHCNAIDTSMLFSVLFALFLVQFIFAHSHFSQKDIYVEIGSKWVLRTRFLVAILGFMIPALMCLPDMLERPDILYESEECKSTDYVLDFNHRPVVQSISLKDCTIEEIQIFTATFDKTVANTELRLDVIDSDTGETISSTTVYGDNILNNGFSRFQLENCILENHMYEIRLQCTAYGDDEYTTIYYDTEGKESFVIDGTEMTQGCMVIRILGDQSH